MIESTSISPIVPSQEGYVQLPPPDMSLNNARQRLLSFLHARTAAPITLFENGAVDIDARPKAYDAQPFDFETGRFKPQAVELFQKRIESVTSVSTRNGQEELNWRKENASARIDHLYQELRDKNRARFQQITRPARDIEYRSKILKALFDKE